MTPRTWPIHTVYAVLILVAAAIAVLGFRSWLQEHDARLQAQEQERVSEAVIQQNDVVVKSLKQQMAETQAEADRKTAVIRHQQAAIKTPAQAVPAIVDAAQLPVNSFKALPTGNYEVTGPATVAIAQTLEDGRVCAVQLTACTSVLASERQTNDLLASNNTELTKEKETWKRAAGHRSFMGRVWEAAKPVVAAIAGGLIVYAVHR